MWGLAACGSGDPAGALPDAEVTIDGATPDPCLACTTDQMCVALYDGVCSGGPHCVAKTLDCPQNACSPACEAAYCGTPYQCADRIGCDGLGHPYAPPGSSFTCEGP